MMEQSIRNPEDALRRSANWSIAVAAGIFFAGVFALAMPMTGALAIALVFGFTAIAAGLLELAFAWQLRSEKGSFWRFVIALAGFVTGAFVLMRPAAGMLVLAFWLGTMVIVRGAMQLMLAWELRGTHFWGWHFFDGVVSIVAGAFIIYAWPVGTVAFLGIWVGISLMMNGLNRFAMAVMLKRLLPPSSKGRPYAPLHA
jgi:uncharacterized membrane protein HdeD (DUF308 family)